MQSSFSVLMEHLQGEHGRRFSRYFIVGLVGAAVNSGLLFWFVESFGMNQILAATLSCEISILSNFVLHDFYTFRDAPPARSYGLRAVYFNAVALTGMVLSVLLMAFLTDGFRMNYMIANLMAMGASTISNFVLNSRFTWSIPFSGRMQSVAAGAGGQ